MYHSQHHYRNTTPLQNRLVWMPYTLQMAEYLVETVAFLNCMVYFVNLFRQTINIEVGEGLNLLHQLTIGDSEEVQDALAHPY